MKISIIVPAYNSETTLEPCLQAIRASSEKEFELIVVDDGSDSDQASSIAQKFTAQVIRHPRNLGRSRARSTALERAAGDIIIFVDSDVVVKEETVGKIKDYFLRHPDVDALSGLLAKDHPHPNFFSQYKNLYMHYIFSRLPERVNFLYGSIHAVRRKAFTSYGSDVRIADDTALGQKFVSQGRTIAFLRDLEVIHLKKYNLFSWIYNDFIIPFEWTQLFIQYRGWRQLGKSRTGYLHARKEQLASIILVPCILALPVISPKSFLLLALLLVLWGAFNFRFLAFLTREKGATFGAISTAVTFMDYLIMAFAIGYGFVFHWIRGVRPEKFSFSEDPGAFKR